MTSVAEVQRSVMSRYGQKGIGSRLGEGQIQCSRPNKAGDMQQARRRERNFDKRGTVHGVISSVENRQQDQTH